MRPHLRFSVSEPHLDPSAARAGRGRAREARAEKAGTPSDIPADARKGFEVYVGVLDKVDLKATAQDLKNMKNVNLSKADQTNVQAFLTYASTACAPSAPSAPDSSAN